MFYQTNLIQRLHDHYTRLANARISNYNTQLASFVRFVRTTPYIAAILAQLETEYPDVGTDDLPGGTSSFALSRMPEDQGETATIVWSLVLQCVDGGYKDMPFQTGFEISTAQNVNDGLVAFTTQLLAVLFEYLADRIVEGSNALYLIEKYKRRTEWFHRAELLGRVKAETRRSEEIVDTDLREYLFDQGIEYPFSQPLSEAGRADIVADIGEIRPLVLEIKLFDLERGYDRGYIGQGFRQALVYAENYGQTVGYLVVFNCTSKRLVFRTDMPADLWPPRIELGHLTVFLVVVDLHVSEASASKRGPIDQYVITRAQLAPDPS